MEEREIKKLISDSRQEILEIVDESIKKRIDHLKPSEDTKDSLNQIHLQCQDKTNKINLAQKEMQRDIKQTNKDLKSLKDDFKEFMKNDTKWKEGFSNDIKENFVTTIEFSPVKRVVYGLVTVILTAVCAAGLGLIIKNI